MIEQAGAVKAELTQRTPNEERRASVRYPASVQAFCRPLADMASPNYPAQVRDLSTLGIGLAVVRPLEPGALLEVGLSVPGGEVVKTVLARVVHCEAETGDSWLVGCAFVSELDDEALQLFQAQRVRPTAPDCRRWVRFPCSVETVCYTWETVPGEQRPARILNVSAGGIGLLLPCQFPVGTLLNFEVPVANGRTVRRLLVRVVRALEHTRGDWFLGCEFAHQLSDEELKALL
jgi:hypothetical protein